MTESNQDILSTIDLKEIYRIEVEGFAEQKNGLSSGQCPFCQSKAFYVILDKLNFKCFGCDAAGSIHEFWRLKYGNKLEKGLQSIFEALETEIETNEKRNRELNKPKNIIVQPEIGKAPSGIFLESDLYLSAAFLSLGKNSMKVLIAVLDIAKSSGNGNLTIPYNQLVRIYKIPRSGISRAFGDLEEKGFLKCVHQGGSGKGDRNFYLLSDDYKLWTPEMKETQSETVEYINEKSADPTDMEGHQLGSKKIPFRANIRAHFRTLKHSLGFNNA
jgi:hypothetical protein